MRRVKTPHELSVTIRTYRQSISVALSQ